MNTASYITELRKCRTLAGNCCYSGLQGPPGPGVEPLYGSFIRKTSQSVVGINSNPNSVAIEFQERTLGSINTLNGVYPNTTIVIPTSGVYRVMFSAQMDSTGGLLPIEIFPVINGISVPDSNTRSVVDVTVESVMTVEYFLQFNTNDRFELYMTGGTSLSPPASNARIVGFPAVPGINGPDIPAIPSIILTIQRIG